MGGIDLDAASDLKANVVHQVPMYYHLDRSAFDNSVVRSSVWLNAPYGDWGPWFAEIVKYWDADNRATVHDRPGPGHSQRNWRGP